MFDGENPQFASYEYYKSTIRYLTGNEEMDTAKRLFAGALAGITSVTATYPLDLVRTRLSMEMSKLALGTPTPGIWSVVKDVYKHEGGIQALYRGLVPTAGVSLRIFGLPATLRRPDF